MILKPMGPLVIILKKLSFKIKTAQGAPIDLQNVHVDVSVDNGLIHVLTDVMSPPSSTIYEWITNHGSFSKLKEAIDEAGLHEQFDSRWIFKSYTQC